MKYYEFSEILKKNILDGKYLDTNKLPTEDSLIEQYGVTRYCVRNAINILIELGEVYSVQGSGMFIRKKRGYGYFNLSHTKGLTKELEGKQVDTIVISVETKIADENLASRMQCDIGTEIYYIVRIRNVDKEPLSVERTYYSKDVIGYIDKNIATDSLFGYIKEGLGLNLGLADKVVYADKLDLETANYLKLDEGDPAFVVEDDVYLSNGVLFNASKVYYNYKKTKFFGSKSVVG